eukprot:520864-Ditylum_brightwellii.AAC.1
MCDRLHFGQAHDTPFTVPPLSVEVKWAANSITSKLILEGDYSNDKHSNIEQLLIQQCKQECNCKLIGEQISRKEWRDKIAVWDERTTTSSLGKHLRHFKALLGRHSYNPLSKEDRQSEKE